jgi:hypothetical protein
MTPQRAHFRQVIRDSLLHAIDRVGGTGPVDADFWAAIRETVLAAGATDTDIDILAVYFVVFVVEGTDSTDRDEREYQLELLARHFTCTDMTIRIGRSEDRIAVEFPSRPRIH